MQYCAGYSDSIKISMFCPFPWESLIQKKRLSYTEIILTQADRGKVREAVIW